LFEENLLSETVEYVKTFKPDKKTV
jgi:hypothetical protein